MARIANAPSETAEGIEITPEMVEAGCKVLWAAAVTDYPMDADKLVVAEIYRAMHSLLREKEATD